MMRVILAGLGLVLIATLSLAAQQASSAPNTLSAAEQKDGFELLFDGKSLDKFIVPPDQVKVWRVVNGVIRNEQAAPGRNHPHEGGLRRLRAASGIPRASEREFRAHAAWGTAAAGRLRAADSRQGAH